MSVKTDYSISVGDIIATLSILFAIYQFRKQMALSRQEHVDSQKETWFLNVIVLPQLPEIKGFYKALSKNVFKTQNKQVPIQLLALFCVSGFYGVLYNGAFCDSPC